MAEERRFYNVEKSMTELRKDIEYIKKTLDLNTTNLEAWQIRCERRFVDRYEFYPVKIIVYGMAGTVLFAVLGGILGLIILN